MDEKYIPYNRKGTKIDGVEPKHCGILATQKEGCLINWYVSLLQFRDLVIQLPIQHVKSKKKAM